MKIKFLAIGSRPWHLLRGYWGFACLVGEDILFDTFCNYRVLSQRLKKGNVDEASLRHVVISHNHWDHTGGLPPLIDHNPQLQVHYPALDVKTLQTGVHVTRAIEGVFDGGHIDEHALIIETLHGLCMIVGCSHPGIVPMVQAVKRDFKGRVHTVIGGLHLMDDSRQTIGACAQALQNEGVCRIAPTHCTGWRAERILKRAFGDGFVGVREGQTLDLL